tara:strand:- start:19427 stop:20101 length:675 start_codon:yes stop_codon:yes gene_type:complete
MKKVVVFTGAGISAESGLGTFRSKGGIWEKFKIEDVATLDAFINNPAKVLEFYNIRRKQLLNSKPNNAHFALNKLSEKYDVSIITQNVDDLHERSGSKNVIHLHGNLTQSKSTLDDRVYKIRGEELNVGDLCNKGSQLRPNIVWFGEEVENMNLAINLVRQASVFIIIGTSLTVFPAASLLDHAINAERKIIVDKEPFLMGGVELLVGQASKVVPNLVSNLLKQ